MKELISNTSTGNTMVTRITLTQSGVGVTSFNPPNYSTDISDQTDNQQSEVYQTDYSYSLSDIVSEQDNWLDVQITVYEKIALFNPTFEIINPFSENTKILVMADKYTVKIFDIGGLTGNVELNFLEGDELISNSENPEDVYFKSTGFRATEIDGKASPIILNPYKSDNPITVVLKLLGNTDPAASGIFRMSVRTIDE